MRRFALIGLIAVAFTPWLTVPVAAQDPGSGLLAVGEMAPDFELPGATRYGLLEESVRLSDFRGETVVLAFFFRVRTRG